MQQIKKFVCQYKYLGKTWILYIDAADHAEAEDRAERLGSLEVLGELGGEVSAGIPGASWMVRGWVRILNLFLPNSVIRSLEGCVLSVGIGEKIRRGLLQGPQCQWLVEMVTDA